MQVLFWMASDALAASVDPGAPVPIVGGQEADVCAWPSAVAVLEDDETPVMCSGSLIHPQVVLTAAHCIIPERPIVALGFGESGQVFGVPQFTVAPIECVPHPNYALAQTNDIAYCLLAEAVEDVPIVPLLAGCEVEELQPGVEVTIVGFGATYGTYDPDTKTISTMGVGAKRWITQTVDAIDLDIGEVAMVGGDGSQSACFGDSGGPALIELSDGTWRVFGAGSHLYDPGGLPPPMEEGNVCGTGVTYGYAALVIDWLESETGFDLTPCFAGDTFVGGVGCGGFPTAPAEPVSGWDQRCGGGSVGGGAQLCAAGETGGSSTGAGVDSTGADETSGASEATGTSSDGGGTTGVVAGSSSDGTDGITTTTTTGPSGESSTDAGAAGESAGGCGCTTTTTTAKETLVFALALCLASRRRRRR